MENILFWCSRGFLALGIVVMAAAMIPVVKMIRLLPPGATADRWKILAGFIAIFFFGYILYTIFSAKIIPVNSFDLVVPTIFMVGALFVYLVSSLSLKTTDDLRRIYILEQESITDPLTGLYNRRYLERRLPEEFQRAMRFQLPFSLLFIDIDHFKMVNDTHGHLAGDQVLHNLAHLITHLVREVDIVVRYGGEEILVILPNTTQNNAYELAERLRRQVADTVITPVSQWKRRAEIIVTVSIGVSEYQFADGWDNGEKALERADKALYRAKEQGRNQTVVGQTCDEKG